VDAEIRVHVIVFIVVETIVHPINVRTNLVNLSELRLLILRLHLLQLLHPPLLLLCRFLSQTMDVSYSYRLLRFPSLLILPYMGLFQERVHLLLFLGIRFRRLHPHDMYQRKSSVFHSEITFLLSILLMIHLPLFVKKEFMLSLFCH